MQYSLFPRKTKTFFFPLRANVIGVGKMAFLFSLVVLFFLFFFALPAYSAMQPSGDILYQLDFTQADKDGRLWLRKQGFTLQKDMATGKSIQLIGGNSDKGLYIASDKPSFGLAVKDGLNFHDIEKVVLEWGVQIYPTGASWQRQINREALMVSLFFGSKVKADRIYLPDSPYFVGMFLCQDDLVRTPYIGKSYRDTGRFICLDRPERGSIIVSSFDVESAYLNWFSTGVIPPLTGIGIELDTSGLPEGQAGAYLKRITFYRQRR